MNRQHIDLSPLPPHRFHGDTDLRSLFQSEIDRFRMSNPTSSLTKAVGEFGGIMIRPLGEQQHALTHIVFPETSIIVPHAGHSMRTHTEVSFPQVRLLASGATRQLYVSISADGVTDDALLERRQLIVPMEGVLLNADLWRYFNQADQKVLGDLGFHPGLSHEDWCQKIAEGQGDTREFLFPNDEIIELKEFRFDLNGRGTVGNLSSFHCMPGFQVSAILANQFTEDGEFFETGSAHIHPHTELTGIGNEVAKRLGERAAQMTVTPADVYVARSSIYANRKLLARYAGVEKRSGDTFMTTVGMDLDGRVIDMRHHDFGLIDNIDELTDLNDRTRETLRTDHPDIGLVVAHYEYFNSSSISSDQLGGHVGEHVGAEPELSG